MLLKASGNITFRKDNGFAVKETVQALACFFLIDLKKMDSSVLHPHYMGNSASKRFYLHDHGFKSPDVPGPQMLNT